MNNELSDKLNELNEGLNNLNTDEIRKDDLIRKNERMEATADYMDISDDLTGKPLPPIFDCDIGLI